MFIFQGEKFETREEAENEADLVAEETFDDVLDECYPEVEVCGYYYPVSEILKRVDPILYRVSRSDYTDSLYCEIEEIDENKED